MSHSQREIPVVARMTVVKPMSGSHYLAALPNGKLVVAHLRRQAPDAWRGLNPGAVVVGELSPYDFEHARVADVLSFGDAPEAGAESTGATAQA